MTNNITNWTKADDARVLDAIRRGASRRELLAFLMAGGVSLAAGGAVLGSAGRAHAATPRKGGKVRAAGWTTSTADTLDPAIASHSTDYVRLCSFYNRLTFLDADLAPQMELAESIETGDAKTWTVKLRSGVTFHSGKTLDANDVVFSLKRHLDPAVGSKVNAIAKQMTEIKAVDPTTVTITLASPNADLPTLLGIHQFMIIADGTKDFTTANGTGPFLCKEFKPGVRSIAVRNPNYWRSSGPWVDEIEFIGIPDDNARVNALLSGDVQIVGSMNPRAIRQIEAQPGFEMMITPSGGYTNLNMRLDMSPGDAEGFVTGIRHLINREQILKAVARGIGDIANDQPLPLTNRYHNAALKPAAFDPEKAKFHLSKSGLLNQTIPVVASDAATLSVEMASVLQQEGARIGMKFDIKRVPADGYWSNYWLKAPMHFGNINARPTADSYFSLLYASDAAWNESRFKSAAFDELLVKARGELDEAKRKELYGEMQVMVAQQAGTVIPLFMANLDALNSKVRGMKPNPLGNLMGFAFPEYIWLAE
ncbi:peptide/nickel transport system substrate-binding protein [Pseudochelatococcus lubricantis]|uniref:Peptide/nickel transport system substrate-binding protein n=1 Tax=Pseudochelatococcus lubricantis TaxID=1538102 RepID=A0ABX0V054_9HYPH|nr:ABC transporter substrate-binding protein [Pseudochelatococcus lubricantis]NIJ58003.1 peptide/nickel transport system substrate-binding protein [Pseudochelatococcus lubricantis]